MPDPRRNLNGQCKECLSSMIDISNKLNDLSSKVPDINWMAYEQQLSFILMAINRLKEDISFAEVDDIPY